MSIAAAQRAFAKSLASQLSNLALRDQPRARACHIEHFLDVEELMSSRGVSLSYETVREWCFKVGQTYANGLRRRSPRPGDMWHLD
jgi:transposase-like protein